MDRLDLENALIHDTQLPVGDITIEAKYADDLILARIALLATESEEFSREAIEDVLLPSDSAIRAQIAEAIRNFSKDIRKIEARVIEILELIDETVAIGLALSAAEHRVIVNRCAEFPLSLTVSRPRFVWSSDRKKQARRQYKPGQRYK
jgi:hypothetical protein